MKRVNIGLDDGVHTKAKLIAVLSGRTLNDFFEEAIKDAIKREEHQLKQFGGKTQ